MLPSGLFNAALTVGMFVVSLASLASGLGSSCSAPITSGTAAPNDPFWLQNIKHQGIAAFNGNPGGYKVFRNVKDYGARGDGVTDDTAAINAAIQDGSRCGQGCDSTTTETAVVFFPQGSYKVSTPIIAYYQTQLVGDARHPPTLLAAPNFQGIAVIDADPYLAGGAQYYTNQNNFFRAVRNFVIDLRQVTSAGATGIHWQVSQATSLYNIVFQMSTAAGNQHQGIFMENGSGGFMGDLIFNGGNIGAWFGNQQFTVRNVTFNNANTAVYAGWNWAWTFQGLTINNCQIGIDVSIGGTTQANQAVEAESIIDAVVTNTPTFIRLSEDSNGSLLGSLVLNNVRLNNVNTAAVAVNGGRVILSGGSKTIDSWAQGNVYHGTNSAATWTQGNIPSIQKPTGILDGSGRIFGKTRPQYGGYAVSQFISVRDQGAKGDGHTDDTQALKNIFAKYSGCKIIFFDAGTYIVTSTITIPAGTQIVGEGWSVIMGSGSEFTDYNNPQPVIQVGSTGSTGVVEISDIIFSTRGPAAGAIVVEWNVHDPAGQQGAAGTWDSHIILGGTAGSNLQGAQCAKLRDNGNNCFAAFMALHLTSGSSAYIEGLWAWLSDHDLDAGGSGQISLYSGRGVMSESQGPVWLIGTGSEHHVEYQYYLNGAKNHYIGLAQTETPYFQPSPVPPAPFITNTAYKDPVQGPGNAWALTVTNSQNILVFGAGFYSFFSNYDLACSNTSNCQQQIINIDSSSSIQIYSLSTLGAVYQLSVNSKGIIPASQNQNGFAQTVTAWTR
ncbi:glucan 1,3-beta-glucosidase [Abortiporus biennis]|nr:glucan 1,3-beta-glucosidase [Abortiporus biennis]